MFAVGLDAAVFGRWPEPVAAWGIGLPLCAGGLLARDAQRDAAALRA